MQWMSIWEGIISRVLASSHYIEFGNFSFIRDLHKILFGPFLHYILVLHLFGILNYTRSSSLHIIILYIDKLLKIGIK